MKSRVCTLLCIIIVLFITAFSYNAVSAKTVEKIDYNFNSITEEESIDFVMNYNIAIPARLQLMKNEGFVTKKIIQSVYNNPNYIFSYNYDAMQEYANSIKGVLLDKYVLNNGSQQSRYSLQYSKVKDSSGNWVTTGGYYDSSWEDYNCYAYSIHRSEASPFYSTNFQYQPGDMADDESGPNAINTFYDCSTISDLAGLVEKDLLAMGYSSITISDSLLTVNSSQELICVRMGDEDYHFMHYDQSTSAWYHKPSFTAVLKYNYVPSNNYIWNNECSYDGIEYQAGIYYDSDIKFIRYNKNSVNISSSTSNLTYYLGINAGKDSILEIKNITNNKYYGFTINSLSSVITELYDANMTLIYSYSGSSITFYRMLSSNTYYLKINYTNANSYGSVTIGINSHTHDYSDHFVWKNYTQHNATCVCGSFHTEYHVVIEGPLPPGQQYATCIVCGGPASMGIVPINKNNLPRSINGSYILPNGIIVLNENDIDDYFDESLVFIYPKSITQHINVLPLSFLKKEEVCLEAIR